MPRATTPQSMRASMRAQVLRREFTRFFNHMRAPEANWEAVADQEFIDALADSLVESSKAGGKEPVTYLQTLIHELQDRVNNITKG